MSTMFANRPAARRPWAALALAGVAALALTGCAGTPHEGAPVIEPAYSDMADARIFISALQQRYLELSARAYDRANVANADFYALRSIMAIEGKAVEMLQPHESALPPPLAEEAGAARGRLIRLFAEGARRYAPEDSARAQALYDCWLREQAPAGDLDQAAICRAAALAAIGRLDSASRGAPVAPVYAASPVVSYAAPVAEAPMIIHEAPIVVAAPSAPAAAESMLVAYEPTPAPVPAAPPAVVAAPVLRLAGQAAAPVWTTPELAPPPEAPRVLYETQAPQPVAAPVSASAPVAPRRPAFDPAPLPDPSAPPPAYDPAPLPDPPARAQPGEPVLDLTRRPKAAAPIKPGPAAESPAPAPQSAPISMPALSASDSGAALAAAAQARPAGRQVYFEFNSDALTPEAEEVLADVAQDARQKGAARISIAGHTDTAGNARYNQLLAMRRAQAARKGLEKLLGAAVAFEILPVGESDLAAPTPDGVREARNRRVDIAVLD